MKHRVPGSQIPRRQDSLAKTGAVLIAVPMILQLVLLAGWFCLQHQANTTALHEGTAWDTSVFIDQIILYDVPTICRVDEAVERHQPIDPHGLDDLQKTLSWCERLKNVWSNSPQDAALVNDLENGTRQLVDLAQHSLSPRSANSPGQQQQQETLAQFKEREDKLNNLLYEIAARMPPAENPQRQSESRKQWFALIIVGTLLNAISFFFIARLFSREVGNRLRLLIDNSMRLARGHRLHPVLPGSDEIARLDAAFHRMSDSLTAAAQRERALIEHARDVLFTLDARLRICTVNSASAAVWGYSAEQLTGKYLRDILESQTQDHVCKTLKLLRAKPDSQKTIIELVTRGRDGRLVDMLCSVNWSAAEGVAYCAAHDISEQKAAERRRHAIMEMVSHDLKNPLTAVRTFHVMLDTGAFGDIDARGRELLSMAKTNTGRMLFMINDLLDMEKLEAGMLLLSKTSIKVASLLEQAVGSVALHAQNKRIRISVNHSAPTIFGDEQRLFQVLVNLLGNAIKFSPEGGTIEVEAAARIDHVEISVTDRGRGIPPEMLRSIFDRFRQVHSTDATEKGGSGLGLAICQGLVQLHGGDISVESKLHQGSKFIVRLPLATREGFAPDPIMKRQV